MTLSMSPQLRDIAIGALKKIIETNTHAICGGFAADYAEYRERVGNIAAYEQAIQIIENACEELMGN